MAEEIQNQKTSGVNYSLMKDRGLNYEEEVLDDNIILPISGDELILDVKDWKPNKVNGNSGGPSWMDSKKDPRFGKEKKPDFVGDEMMIGNGNYEYIKPREGLHVLNMKNIPERWIDENIEENYLKEDLIEAEKIMKRNNIKDAIDQDEWIKKGEENQSKNKRIQTPVNMKQQLNRQINMHRSDAPNVQYEVKDDIIRPNINSVNWDLALGREAKVITKEKVQNNGGEDDDITIDGVNIKEEVQISPNKDVLSG